jgi:lysozyme
MPAAMGGMSVAKGTRMFRRLAAFASLAALPACLTAGDEPAATGSAQYAAEACADGDTVYGIDVSRFQGNINWAQVKGHGVKYAWIQVSRFLDDIDAEFEDNWAGAKANGILRGAYQRFHPGESVSGQAQIMLDKIGTLEPNDLPPMLDVEDADGLSKSQVAAAVQEWMDIVEPAVGVKPFIYTGYYFWKDSVGSAAFADHPLWIANYSATCPLIPDAWSRWTIHQYSSTNHIPGITANSVDENRFNGTMEDLMAFTVGGAGEAEPCAVVPAEGGVVDDTGPCFRAGGDQQYIRSENAGYGSKLKWTHTTDSPTASNYGQWTLHFAEAGRYRVEAFTQAPFAESKQAVYLVKHGGEETAADVDQTATDGWQTLGEFEFAAGGNQSIRVNDNTGEPNETNTQLVFDAVQLTRLDGDDGNPDIDDEDGDGDGDGDDEEGSSGMISACAAGGGASGPGASALLLLALVRLRRRRPARQAQH